MEIEGRADSKAFVVYHGGTLRDLQHRTIRRDTIWSLLHFKRASFDN